MPVPPSVTTRVVRGTYVNSAGTAQRGTITFRIDQPLIATVESWGVTPGPIIVPLDTAGAFTTTLMASDDIDLFPSGFRYTVQERFQSGYVRTYSVEVPTDADPLDLPSATQYDPGDVGLAVVRSVNGRTGIVQLSALDLSAVPLSQKGVASGVATLDSGGKIPAAQLPAGTAGVASVDGRTGVVVLTDLYSATGHTHAYPVTSVNAKTGVVVLSPADVGAVAASLLGANSGVATLDSSGKLLGAQVPSVAITDVHDAGSQAAMLALAAERGDLARRTDLSKTFVLTATDPSILANWKELLTPADAVTSVNGLTGTVVLTAGTVGAVATTAIGAAGGVASLDGSTLVPVAQIPNLPGSRITSGLIDVARLPTGATGTTVSLGNHTHSYVALTEKGAVNGVASLDSSGRIPIVQIPSGVGAVQSVNGQVGLVVLTASDVSALAASARGTANGVASLDSGSLVPVAQIPGLDAAKVTSGTLDIARLPTGATSTTVSLGNHTHSYIPIAEKGAPGGVATLDGSSKVALGLIPTGDTSSSVALGNHDHNGVYLGVGSVGQASGVASLDSSTLVPVAQIPNLNTSKINAGVLDIARLPTGTTSTTVSVGNHTHGYIPVSEKGANSGVASLDSSGKVPTSQLPVITSVSSVNSFTGAVVLTAADVGAVDLATRAQANGVATLDSSTLVPIAQIPNLATSKITSGTFDIARIPTGSSSTTVSPGNHTHSYIASSDRGAANGVAPLDSSSLLPVANLPTYMTRSILLAPADPVPGDAPVGAMILRYDTLPWTEITLEGLWNGTAAIPVVLAP